MLLCSLRFFSPRIASFLLPFFTSALQIAHACLVWPRLLLVTHASDIKYDNEDNNDNDVAQLQQQQQQPHAKDNETRQFWEREQRRRRRIRWALVLIARRHSPPTGMGWL
ncbi:hypothetical protein ACLKA6_011645 [Drosophila palustris]